MRLRILDQYFATMTAAHIGQGADIAGLANIMSEVVKTGNSELATQFIIGIHTLKSGVPVRNMAQSGGIIGCGTEAQVQGLGEFFEQLGIAFQIIDDVVNLEGFSDDNWKTAGEDVMEGKVRTIGMAEISALVVWYSNEQFLKCRALGNRGLHVSPFFLHCHTHTLMSSDSMHELTYTTV